MRLEVCDALAVLQDVKRRKHTIAMGWGSQRSLAESQQHCTAAQYCAASSPWPQRRSPASEVFCEGADDPERVPQQDLSFSLPSTRALLVAPGACTDHNLHTENILIIASTTSSVNRATAGFDLVAWVAHEPWLRRLTFPFFCLLGCCFRGLL